MPQEHDTEKPSPEKKRLRLRRSDDEGGTDTPTGDQTTKDSTAASPVPAVPAPPPKRTPAEPKPRTPVPAAAPGKPEPEPENESKPIGAPGGLMREALKKEQQAAAPAERPTHEKSPNLTLIVVKLVILLILFGGGLSLVIHALFNLDGDDSADSPPAPARTTTSHSPDRQQNPVQPSPAPKSNITIIDEGDVLPGITIDDAPPAPAPAPAPTPAPPTPTPSVSTPTPAPAPPAVTPPQSDPATRPAPPAEDPAVKRWLDQVTLSGILGSRMILNQRVFNLGDTVNVDLGVRWTDVDHQNKILTFTDKNSITYTLRF